MEPLKVLAPFVLGMALLALLCGCTLPEKTAVLTAPYKDNSLAVAHRFVPLEEGALYTSREPSEALLLWLIEEKGVKTFISLKGDIPQWKEDLIEQKGAELKTFSWSAHRVPPREELDEVLGLMRERENGPVHVFCRAGADRTGLVRAWWRFFYQGWSEEEALAEFRGMGHIPNVLDTYLKNEFAKR
ncbi:MAG: hypothetical protein HY457_01510 [Parcubacteria group bacterium]|nr:hypothetical protein [Parcubacteria group bacterium]